MDLKFTFGGASSDHGHDDAPPGVSLPFPTAQASTSSVLEILVRPGDAGLVAEAVSGDGVTYARAQVACDDVVPDQDPTQLALLVRSALARVVAELDGPLAMAITGVVLELGEAGSAVIVELGVDPGPNSAEPGAAAALVTEALQRRTGIASGTPVRLA